MVLSSRRAAIAASLAALVPLTGEAKKGSRRCRTRRVNPLHAYIRGLRTGFDISQFRFCPRGFCPAAPECSVGCRCLGAGAGFGICVLEPTGDEEPCEAGACAFPHFCLETCEHPGEARCYERCLVPNDEAHR